MLYLINETFYDKESKEIIDLLKIGYTSESSKPGSRFSSYLQHCPEAKLLYEIPGGTLFHESALLDKFHHLLYCGNEWFKYDQEIIDYFDNHRTLESLEDDLVTPDLVSYVEIKNYCIKCLNLLLNSRIESGDITLQQATNTQSSMLNVLLKLRFKNFQQVDKHFLHLFKFDVHKGEEIVNLGVNEFLREFDRINYFTDKMRLLCESDLTIDEINSILNSIPIEYKNYYTILGPNKIRSLSYQRSKLKLECNKQKNNQLSSEDLEQLVFSRFIVNEKYTKPYIKQMLSTIYSELGIQSTPKATDLKKYFDIKLVDVIDETGKRTKGFKILKKKDL